MCLDLPTEATRLQHDPLAALDALLTFRAAVYAAFGHRRDALFEILDALTGAGAVTSPIHLSLEAVHRRGWGSFYAALHEGEIPVDAIEALLAQHPLAAATGPLLYGVDTSVWPRCDRPGGTRDQPRARVLPSLVPPLGGEADRRWVVVPVGRPTQPDP